MTEIEFLSIIQNISSKAQDTYCEDVEKAKQVYLEALQKISNLIILRQQEITE